MATFFSGQAVGNWAGQTIWGTLTGNVSRSGNTVTLSSLTLSMTAASAWGTDNNWWVRIYSGDTQLSSASGLSFNSGSASKGIPNASVGVGATATSHTFNLRTSDGNRVNFTVSFPAGQSAPATPTCTASSNSATLVNITWGTSNLGNPAGTVSLYEGTTNNPTELLYSKTTTGTNVFGRDQRTANTTYYYKATASNSVGTVSSAVTSATTYPAGINSVSVSTTDTTATFSIDCANSGNALTTTLQKSHNAGATWVDIATDVQGTTVTHTETNLTPETLYTAYFRVTTTAGSSASVSKSYSTQPKSKFYGSVNGQAKRITKLYGSVNGQTKKITKLYGSVNGVTKLIYKG